jgi:hypothetical protein
MGEIIRYVLFFGKGSGMFYCLEGKFVAWFQKELFFLERRFLLAFVVHSKGCR